MDYKFIFDIFKIGPFSESIKKKVDSYLMGKGADLPEEREEISENRCYKTQIKKYSNCIFEIKIDYDINVRKEVNAVKIEAFGNGNFTEELESALKSDLTEILESEQILL